MRMRIEDKDVNCDIKSKNFRRCSASLCALHTSAHILPGGACSPVRVQYDCEIGRWDFLLGLLTP